MTYRRRPLPASPAVVCCLLVISPVLLTSCENSELDFDYRNLGSIDYDDNDEGSYPRDNIGGHFSNNHLFNEVIQYNSRSNNDGEDTEVKRQNEEFVYSNISMYLSIIRNRSAPEGNDSDADYEYDYDESHNIFNWSELIPTLVIYGVTMVIGIAGNSLIIFTICHYRRMKSTTNVFLASLASADLLLIIICIPVKVRSWPIPSSCMVMICDDACLH
jgi:hypothetical protein